MKTPEAKKTETLRITEYALEKAFAYAKAAFDEYRSECIGYLLAPLVPGEAEKQELTVDDVILPPGQIAYPYAVELPPRAVLEVGRRITRLGKSVVGWVHSHGSLGCFSSAIDDENTGHLVTELAAARLRRLRKELEVRLERADGGVAIKGPSGSIASLTNPELGAALESLSSTNNYVSIMRFEFASGKVYSLVVNARGDSYAEVAEKTWCPVCGRAEIETRPVEITVCQTPSRDVKALDIRRLREEVRKKIIPQYWTRDWRWKWPRREYTETLADPARCRDCPFKKRKSEAWESDA